MKASPKPMSPVLELVPSSHLMSPITLTTDHQITPTSMSTSTTDPSHESSLVPSPSVHEELIPVPTITAPPRRTNRLTKPLLWLQDFITKLKINTCLYPLDNHITYSHLSSSYKQALLAY